MDTNKEYIKMCDNRWIQELWHINWGDYYCDKPHEPEVISSIGNVMACKDTLIWLPRQDQLQKMLKETHLSTPLALVEFLYSELNDDENCPSIPCCKFCKDNALYFKSFKTMEQLWLAFVMSEKYNKIWDKNKWIKQ